TRQERANPALLQASRKRRIAAGAGLEVQELNRLLKQHRQMADVMKKMGRQTKGGAMRAAVQQMMGKGGMPDPAQMDPAALQAAANALKSGGGLPGLGGGALPQGL